jgi:hypothetical protein
MTGTPTAHYDLRELFKGVTKLDPVGSTVSSGRPAWRFAIAPRDVDPTVLGFALGGVTDLRIRATRFEVILDELGLPTGAEMAADVAFKTAAGALRAGTLDYTWAFSQIGQPLTVSPPADYWVVHHSSRLGYSMAFPGTDEVVEQATKGGICAVARCDHQETFVGDAALLFQVYHTQTSQSAKQVYADVKAMLEGAFDAKLSGNELLTIAGHPGRLFTVVKAGFGNLYAVVIVGKQEWDVSCLFEKGNEKVARDTLMKMLATFTIG